MFVPAAAIGLVIAFPDSIIFQPWIFALSMLLSLITFVVSAGLLTVQTNPQARGLMALLLAVIAVESVVNLFTLRAPALLTLLTLLFIVRALRDLGSTPPPGPARGAWRPGG